MLTSNCCNATFFEPGWPDNDICSSCKEHADVVDNQEEMKLLLIKENNRWINIDNKHINYGLDNALHELYMDSGIRKFIIENDKVFCEKL